MSLLLLRARDRASLLYFRILLDDTKVDAGNTPMPEWVVEYSLVKNQRPGETDAAFRTRVWQYIRQMALSELASRQAGAEQILTGEGATF